MKKLFIFLIIFLTGVITYAKNVNAILIEAESFDNKGGWVVDQQSMDVMGSPYLMAHGMGSLVDDASTSITFPAKGKYQVFVRTRNWTAQWSNEAAGQFKLSINGDPLKLIF